MEIQVEIIAEGMAKELNAKEFPERRKFNSNIEYTRAIQLYQQSESQRRVFKIVDCKNVCVSTSPDCCTFCEIVGSIHTAEIVNENEVIIK